MRSLLVAVVCLTCGTSLCAIRFAGPGGGGWIETVCPSRHDDHRILVGCDVGGFYFSSDGGRSYEIRNRGLGDPMVETIAEHPTDPSVLIVGGNGGLYKSEDVGRNWRKLTSGLPEPIPNGHSLPVIKVVWDESNPNRIYAATGCPRGHSEGGRRGHVYRSDDGGESWRMVVAPDDPLVEAFPTEILDLSVNAQDGRELLAVTSRGLFRSTDAAEHWQKAGDGLPDQALVRHVARSRVEPKRIYLTVRDGADAPLPRSASVWRSDDGGRTWARTSDLPAVQRTSDGAEAMDAWGRMVVAVDPHDPDVVWCGGLWYRTALCVSRDGGRSWRVATEGLPLGWIDFWKHPACSLAVSPRNGNVVTFGSAGGLFGSEDGGRTWAQRYAADGENGVASTGLDVLCVSETVHDRFARNRALVAFYDVGLMVTDNGGAGWRRCVSGIPKPWSGTCFSVAQSTVDSNRWWAVFGRWGAKSQGLPAVSDDGGCSWKLLRDATGWTDAKAGQMRVLPGDPEILAVVHERDGLLLSRDGARTWTRPSSESFPDSERCTALGTANGCLFAGTKGRKGMSPQLWRSDDRGVSWRKVWDAPGEAEGEVTSIAATNGRIVFCVKCCGAKGGCWLSKDDGKTWRRIYRESPWNDLNAVAIAGDEIVLASRNARWHDDGFGGRGLLSSADDGRTWRRHEENGFDRPEIMNLAVNPFCPSEVWVGTWGNSLAILNLADDVRKSETARIQGEIDRAAAQGGGRVVLSRGIHPCGTLYLKSGVELHLEDGAVLLGGDRSEDYDDAIPLREVYSYANSHSNTVTRKAFIYAENATNVAITGKGVIDGQGPKFFDRNTLLWGCYWAKPPCMRPRMVVLMHCKGVRFEETTFKDCPVWTMWLRHCEDVVASKIRVVAEQKMINSDGIDFDACRNVRVGDSYFKTGDDCLILRAIRHAADAGREVVTENVVVSNCYLNSACQGVRIGCPSDDLIRNAVFRDITCEGNNAIFADQQPQYLEPGDAGSIRTRDILFENWTIRCRGYPISVAIQDGVQLKDFGHMTFRNIRVDSPKPIRLCGNESSLLRDVTVEGLSGIVRSRPPVEMRQTADVRLKGVRLEETGRLAPFSAFRLKATALDDPSVWRRTVDVLSANRELAEEVWFSTGVGFPSMDFHHENVRRIAEAMEDVRAVGILPGLQIQSTIGHGDSTMADPKLTAAMRWQGFTGSDGTVCRTASCPRDSAFLAYMDEMARLYAALHPSSVWIDDDLRNRAHHPVKGDGCYCDGCIAAFSRRESLPYTRESLVAACRRDSALAARWKRFEYEGLAAVAGMIAGRFHDVSPETEFGLQTPCEDALQPIVLDEIRKVTGSNPSVRAGGGGGAYLDHDPFRQIVKSFGVSRELETLGERDRYGRLCPEIESYPRHFACRVPESVLLEALLDLSVGTDSLSFFIADFTRESPEWYAENLLKPVNAKIGFLREYVESVRGSRPAGFTWKRPDPASVAGGVPYLSGWGLSYGSAETLGNETERRIDDASSERFRKLSARALEESKGRVAAICVDPAYVVLYPRVDADGFFRAVTIVRPSIGSARNVRLRLNGLPPDRRTLEWCPLDGERTRIPVTRSEKDGVLVTIPEIRAWSAGYLLAPE